MPATDHIQCALLQYPVDTNQRAQRQQLESNIRSAATRGNQLIVLSELHNSPYFCQTESADHCDLAEPIPGPSTDWLATLAAELDIVIVGSLFESRAAGLYHNTAVVLDGERGLVGKYRKMHIPDDPGYYEKYYFTPGDLGFQPIETRFGKLGVLICWDQWFPEAARLMALAGAELLIYPTAIGFAAEEPADEQDRQANAWQLVQRGHAIANGLPLLSCNRVGHEPDPSGQSQGIEFWGRSFACGPQGELLATAAGDAATLEVSIDLRRSEQVRRTWPLLRDRRIDAYQGLQQRYID